MICWDALTLTQKHCSHADSAWCNATYVTFALGLDFEKKKKKSKQKKIKTTCPSQREIPAAVYEKWLRLDQQRRAQNSLLTERPPARPLILHADGVFLNQRSLFECLQFKIILAVTAVEWARGKVKLWKRDLIRLLFWHSVPEAEIRWSLPWMSGKFILRLCSICTGHVLAQIKFKQKIKSQWCCHTRWRVDPQESRKQRFASVFAQTLSKKKI